MCDGTDDPNQTGTTPIRTNWDNPSRTGTTQPSGTTQPNWDSPAKWDSPGRAGTTQPAGPSQSYGCLFAINHCVTENSSWRDVKKY